MVKTFVVAGAATLLMSVVAAPTAMAAETWEMPSLEGMNLEEAQALYTETVGPDGPWLDIINKAPAASGGINAPVMREVCEQAPSPARRSRRSRTRPSRSTGPVSADPGVLSSTARHRGRAGTRLCSRPCRQHTAPRSPLRRSRSRRARDLDVVAVLAVILVVIGHFWLGRVTGGVDVLLVLAGYFAGDRRCAAPPFPRRSGGGPGG